uniref:uncharacterized protein LOC114583618 n=1 Tax=Podarcis muralis TaxID=64176 RepID=UPI00109FE844|nr:uncharacterized protein LOC114583618 [Podarcis muralis]
MSRVFFGKDRWLLHVYRPPSPLASFTYTRRLSPQDSGEHLCTYRAAESSWNISSLESRRIRISVMAPPPAPVLTVDPPSGVVKEGGFLRLTCSAFGSDAEQRFHFYRDGVKISSSSEESLADSGEPRNAFSNASANILVQVTASIHTGGFACRYEQKLSSRWIMSPWSQTVNLTGEPCPNISQILIHNKPNYIPIIRDFSKFLEFPPSPPWVLSLAASMWLLSHTYNVFSVPLV